MEPSLRRVSLGAVLAAGALLTIGDDVEIEYEEDDSGQRIALEIELEGD